MMLSPMTIDLLATLHIVDDDVAAVVDAYMADPQRGTVRFGEGFEIDPAVALAAHPFASQLIGQPWAGEELRRAAVHAAIMLARPQRAREPRTGLPDLPIGLVEGRARN